jgi:hypothetical protein
MQGIAKKPFQDGRPQSLSYYCLTIAQRTYLVNIFGYLNNIAKKEDLNYKKFESVLNPQAPGGTTKHEIPPSLALPLEGGGWGGGGYLRTKGKIKFFVAAPSFGARYGLAIPVESVQAFSRKGESPLVVVRSSLLGGITPFGAPKALRLSKGSLSLFIAQAAWPNHGLGRRYR